MKNFRLHYIVLVITSMVLSVAACDSINNGEQVIDNGEQVFSKGKQVIYKVTLLPSHESSSSKGIGINNQDWITGGTNAPDNQTIQATLWKNGTVADLGTLGGPNSNIVWPGINDRGMLVGISETEDLDTTGTGTNFSCHFFFPGEHTGYVCRGFAWEEETGMIPMPTLGGNNSFATNVNNKGQVVGWAETEVNDPTCNTAFQVKQFRGVIWEPEEGRITELSPLPGDSVTAAVVINNSGDVAGISGECGIAVGSVSARHMVFWADGGEPIQMDDLGGVNWHTPMSINEQGTVVGFSNPPEVTDGGLTPHAFIWTEKDGIRDLGTLPGDTTSQALGINDRGQMVGLSRNANGNSTAVIWHDKFPESIQDLNELVSEDFTGQLIFANDINNRGVITGVALDPVTGNTVAFRATPSQNL